MCCSTGEDLILAEKSHMAKSRVKVKRDCTVAQTPEGVTHWEESV